MATGSGPIIRSQLEFPLERRPSPDRNFDKGGRSFYFFDLDDNVLHLATEIVIYHQKTGEERRLTTREYVHHSRMIGKSGLYKDFEIRPSDAESFRRFRDWPHENPFIEDMMSMLWTPEHHWQGPSWNFFYHAVFNERPLTVITARGHEPTTIERGLDILVSAGILPRKPNYVGIYPVSNPELKSQLCDSGNATIAQLKKRAVHHAVHTSMQRYGENPYHRFGMSDDDPENLRWVEEAFRELKSTYQGNRFFTFHAKETPPIRREVLLESVSDTTVSPIDQLSLFGDR